MKQFLIIPDRKNLEESIQLANEYALGYEYNEFFLPEILDDEEKTKEIIKTYKNSILPEYCTLHGAFFDVIPFSMDAKIREVSELRIEQSINIAREIGAKAVVFHTNYNPFLNTEKYIEEWVIENAKIWSDILERHADINIYLENMFDTSPVILEKLSKELCKYPNYGVCLDYAHAALSKVSPETWAERLGKYVKHVHINDNDFISDLHLPWGDGKIDRQRFYQAYEEHLNGATILIEMSTMEKKLRSLKVLKAEGFLN